MRGILAIASLLMMSIGTFLILKNLLCLQAAAGAAVLVFGTGLYIDSFINERKNTDQIPGKIKYLVSPDEA